MDAMQPLKNCREALPELAYLISCFRGVHPSQVIPEVSAGHILEEEIEGVVLSERPVISNDIVVSSLLERS
jgi:hypothetical protein